MATISNDKWAVYFDARDTGLGVADSAKKAGIDRTTAYKFERGTPGSSGLRAAEQLGRNVVAGKIVNTPLPREAGDALTDFAYFRLRYMGRKSTPWQEAAAYEVLKAVETDQREWVVINVSPGGGKSTLFTHDVVCWLIARNRAVRILIGSRTERQAKMYVARIKRTLERTHPLKNDPDAVAAGKVFDAQSTLQADYGPFKPEGRSDLWRHEALVVQQPGGQAVDDKEPTVSAYGQDSGFLGGRYDIVLWDDLVDSRNTRTEEGSARLKEWYSTEAETRLEPGGAFILQGQRIAADDLYRYALDLENIDGTKKYRHIIYRAHDDDNCHGDHGPDAKPWPDGCLLDPYRLPWHELQRIQANEPRTYNLMYQQNDDFTLGGLIDPTWLTGGTDNNGEHTPGCYDTWRANGTIPAEWTDRYSFITVDPSPAEYWGICWWLYDDNLNELALIDTYRGRLTPEQFLYRNDTTFQYSGLIEDWAKRAQALGAPLDTIVVEINAAQRWLLAQPHIQTWQQTSGITFTPHTTARNKSDPEYGVETLGAWYKHGRIRLPWATPAAKAAVHPLTQELLKYPTGKTTDMLMSNWFATLHINTGYRRKRQGTTKLTAWRPNATRGLVAGGIR